MKIPALLLRLFGTTQPPTNPVTLLVKQLANARNPREKTRICRKLHEEVKGGDPEKSTGSTELDRWFRHQWPHRRHDSPPQAFIKEACGQLQS